MKIVTVNKKAFHDYEILTKYEAGLVLLGSEVKSIRAGAVSLKDSYVEIRAGEAFLVSSHIGQYANASFNNHEPRRERKLLLNRREIRKCDQRVQVKGLTIIPLRMYLNDKGLVKLEIGLAKGKRQYEKKQKIKDRDIKREVERELKHYR
jgi:SsrA-binding protein